MTFCAQCILYIVNTYVKYSQQRTNTRLSHKFVWFSNFNRIKRQIKSGEMAETSKNEKEHAKILSDLNTLRNEQRNIVGNISQLELDLKEHKTVIDTLKSVEEDRKCFRLIGGVLCERTVKSVLPQLNDAKEQLEKLIAQRQEQLTAKGVEINKFREKHNIKIKGEGSAPGAAEQTPSSSGDSEENRNHVLVAN